MDGDIRDLYQEVILDHSKKPRNFGPLKNPTRKVEGYNPLCGDRYTIAVKIENDVVSDIRFEGAGCAISKASASMMTAAVKGKRVSEAREMFEKFHQMLSRDSSSKFDAGPLGKLSVFSGVCEYPARVKCATLAWHTFKSALDGENAKSISTE